MFIFETAIRIALMALPALNGPEISDPIQPWVDRENRKGAVTEPVGSLTFAVISGSR